MRHAIVAVGSCMLATSAGWAPLARPLLGRQPRSSCTGSQGSRSSNSPEAHWQGNGLSQQELMLQDECVLVDRDDRVIGHASKFDAHVFNATAPEGTCHRAFSVFLFDPDGRLLLQKRASTKVTFPGVWTNACCSHPLAGQPNEVDEPSDVASGLTPGIKRAAVRKLKHELGIEASEVPEARFKFLTRIHYWAADTLTHGPNTAWGEHEIDYVLALQAPVNLRPNPDEVDDVKYVTPDELRAMLDGQDQGDVCFSPWFRVIARNFLLDPLVEGDTRQGWWADLAATLTTDKHVDTATIHRFHPPFFEWSLPHEYVHSVALKDSDYQ